MVLQTQFGQELLEVDHAHVGGVGGPEVRDRNGGVSEALLEEQRPPTGTGSSAQVADARVVSRKRSGRSPATYSSALRPEVSAARCTRSLNSWRLRIASCPSHRASLNSAIRQVRLDVERP